MDEVREAGGAAVLPVGDVMALTPLAGAVAAWEPTPDVTQHQRRVHGGRDRAGGAAVVENRTEPVGDDPVDAGITQESAHRVSVDGPSGERAAGAAMLEVVEVDDDVHVRPVPAA